MSIRIFQLWVSYIVCVTYRHTSHHISAKKPVGKLHLHVTNASSCPNANNEGIWETFVTMARHGGEWSASHAGYFTAGKRTLSTHGSKTLRWHQNWSGHFTEKQYLLLQPGIESLIIQPVAVTILS
jgi:hypothetical protein